MFYCQAFVPFVLGIVSHPVRGLVAAFYCQALFCFVLGIISHAVARHGHGCCGMLLVSFFASPFIPTFRLITVQPELNLCT